MAIDQRRTPDGPPDPESLTANQWKRRQRIIDCARGLLEESSYDEIQMRDIASRADVALGTMYRYFASKEHLFAAVLMEWSLMLGQRVQHRPFTADEPAKRLHQMMQRVLRSFERWPQFFAVYSLLETTTDPYAQELHAQFNQRTRGTFTEALEGLEKADSEVVIEVVNAVLVLVIRGWTLGTMSMPEARARVARCIDLVFSEPPGPAAELPGQSRAGRAVPGSKATRMPS